MYNKYQQNLKEDKENPQLRFLKVKCNTQKNLKHYLLCSYPSEFYVSLNICMI